MCVCSLLTEILRQCPDANEIQFSEDGQYKAISEKASKSSSSASKPVKMETVIGEFTMCMCMCTEVVRTDTWAKSVND